MKRIFFTGVTGFLGRFLAVRLLAEDNYLILLARKGNNGETAKDRVKNALMYADKDVYEKNSNNYEVIEGDVTEVNLGLSDDYPLELAASVVDEVYHVAGSISFAEKKREKIIGTNLVGTHRMLEFLNIVRPEKFHYFSTAYVHNDKHRNAYEDELDYDRKFNNPYEESKCRAEFAVSGWAERHPRTTTFIYRPSIVVGDSKTGKICNFSGYYRYMRTFHIIKRTVLRRKDKADYIDANGDLQLDIDVPGIENATINIVTVDYVVDVVMEIRSKDTGGVYHIVNENPPKYGWLLEQSLKILGITGPSANGRNKEKEKEGFLSSIEAHIESGLHDYIPYISKNIVFNTRNGKESLRNDYKSHPGVTPKLVGTLLGFAMDCEFKEDPLAKAAVI